MLRPGPFPVCLQQPFTEARNERFTDGYHHHIDGIDYLFNEDSWLRCSSEPCAKSPDSPYPGECSWLRSDLSNCPGLRVFKSCKPSSLGDYVGSSYQNVAPTDSNDRGDIDRLP